MQFLLIRELVFKTGMLTKVLVILMLTQPALASPDISLGDSNTRRKKHGKAGKLTFASPLVLEWKTYQRVSIKFSICFCQKTHSCSPGSSW